MIGQKPEHRLERGLFAFKLWLAPRTDDHLVDRELADSGWVEPMGT
jgi:hypothetical protein